MCDLPSYVGGSSCPYNENYYSSCIEDKLRACKESGYSITSCSMPNYPYGQCPYNTTYYTKCQADTPRACQETGYQASCPSGYVTNTACPYNSSYTTCKCNPCSGYDYTYEQTTAQGYVTNGSCNSCGTSKYKRKQNPCSGYSTCDCGGATGASVCYTGITKKFNSCKACCDDTCPSGSRTASCPSGKKVSSYTKCGNACYTCCDDTCYSGSRYPSCGYNQNTKKVSITACGNYCYSCCDDTCSSGELSPSCPSGYYEAYTGRTSCGNSCYECLYDECANVSCGANAYCSSGTCYCNSGYEGNPNVSCSDPCETDPCHSGCYIDHSCKYGCAATNECGGCIECLEKCDADPCNEGCYTDKNCSGDKCMEYNKYGGCERCAMGSGGVDLPCDESDPCNDPNCASGPYRDLTCEAGCKTYGICKNCLECNSICEK